MSFHYRRAVGHVDGMQRARDPGRIFVPSCGCDQEADAVDIVVQRGMVPELKAEKEGCAMRIDSSYLQLHLSVAVLQKIDTLDVFFYFLTAAFELRRVGRFSSARI